MGQSTHEVSISTRNFKVNIDGLDNPVLNNALGMYLRNQSFNSYDKTRGKDFAEPQYNVDNLCILLPDWLMLPEDIRLPTLFKSLEGKSYEETRQYWDENYSLSSRNEGNKGRNIKAIVSGEVFKVDVFDYGDNLAVMYLPYSQQDIGSCERLVSPIITGRKYRMFNDGADNKGFYTEEEMRIIGRIAHRVWTQEPIQGTNLRLEEVCDGLTSWGSGEEKSNLFYPVTKPSDGTSALYLVYRLDWSAIVKEVGDFQQYNGHLIIKYMDKIVRAARAIRSFVKEQEANIENTVTKHINSVSDC